MEEALTELSEAFSQYDQLVLVKNQEFLKFVNYKIIFISIWHNYEGALIRV